MFLKILRCSSYKELTSRILILSTPSRMPSVLNCTLLVTFLLIVYCYSSIFTLTHAVVFCFILFDETSEKYTWMLYLNVHFLGYYLTLIKISRIKCQSNDFPSDILVWECSYSYPSLHSSSYNYFIYIHTIVIIKVYKIRYKAYKIIFYYHNMGTYEQLASKRSSTGALQ